MELQTWNLSNVVRNPYRDFDGHPLQESRIERLMESIKTNGLDTTLEGRVVNGKLQLAAGHHRVEALRRLGRTEEAFLVQDFTELQMVRKLRRDNDTEYEHGPEVWFELVSGVVKGFASGRLTPDIPKNTAHTLLRYAPFYLPNPNPIPPDSVPYTAVSVAEVIGDIKNGEGTESDGHGGVRASFAVKMVLRAFEFMEMGIIERNFLFYGGDASKKNPVGCCKFGGFLGLEHLLKFALERSVKVRAEAQKKVAADAAHVLACQQRLDAIRKEEADEGAARSTEYARLPELAEEAIEKEARERWEKIHEKQKREKALAPQLRKRKMAFNRELEAKKKKQDAEQKRAEQKAAKIRIAGPKPRQPYVPELAELLRYFGDGLPACHRELLRLKHVLTPAQKETLRKAIAQSAMGMRKFLQELN